MKSILLLIFLAIPILLHSQQTWSRLYFNPFAVEQSTNVISTTDSSFAVSGGESGHLIKVNASGDILFRQYYDEIEQAFDLVETRDGGFALLGHSESDNLFNDEITLIRTDNQGKLLWSKVLDLAPSYTSFLSTQDNGFAVIGFNFGQLDFTFYLLDPSGNITIQNNNGVGGRIIQLDNGDFVCANTARPYSTPSAHPEFVYLNAQGEIVWERASPDVRSVQHLSTSDLVTLSMVGEDKALTKYDSAGNLIWQKTYPELPGILGNSLMNRLLVNDRDEIAFATMLRVDADTGGGNTQLAKFDADGNLICTAVYAFPNHVARFEGLDGTPDFGFIISGGATRRSRNNDSSNDLFLIKTDSLCQTGEFEVTRLVNPQSGNPNPNDPTTPTDPTSTFSFKYYPNPTSGLVNFEIDTGDDTLENLNIYVIDMLGRTVHQESITTNDFTLNLLDLPSGTYYFEIYEADLKLGTGKLILTKF